jgi:hypothetical protein
MAESNQERWRELCAAAAEETDSDQLFFLVNQILEAFDNPQKSAVSADSFEPCS